MDHDHDDARDAEPERLDLDEAEPGGSSPTPTAGEPDLASLLRTGERWGYVDDDGAIHVRAGKFNADRVVARVPPSKRAETIANLLLAFGELETRYAALRKELRRSKNPARNLKSLRSFVHWVEGAEAIGDYDDLLGRAHAEIERIEGRLAAGQADKLALVERAEALAESSTWRSSGEAMDELMEEWKRAGSAGREQDEALWQRFNEARRVFFNRRSAHFAELKQSRTEAREAKEALIARAGELAPSTDYDGGFTAMQELLEEWKRAGSAGRDVDEQLWQRFHDVRDPFFERRKAYLAEQRRRQGDRGRGGGEPGGPRGRDREAPRGRERGGPRRGGDRGPGGPPGQRPRGGDPGVLRSSLADLVGPLRDLFPADRPAPDTDDDAAAGKKRG
ncbi:MAG: DUF349 domain-containing protein [Thermoanaerobaculales bacterium]|jgi:hypothetical protein|nr:DUF349 domain-containing protein [Thermoanaerobaculales bacterium]